MNFNQIECFSFDHEITKKKNPYVNQEIKSLQQNILQNYNLQFQQFQILRKSENQILEQDIKEFPLNQQIYVNFPAAIKTTKTLYEVFLYSLLYHFYIGITPKKIEKLNQFKKMIYTGQLDSLIIPNQQLNEQYHSINNNDAIKRIVVKCFKLLEAELLQNEKSNLQLQAILYKMINKHNIIFIVFSIVLRKLVQQLSKIYEMQIEQYSVVKYKQDPQMDILWLLCQFFQINITLFILESNFIKQEKFKVNQNQMYNFVKNGQGETAWTYLYLKQTYNFHIKQLSFMQQDNHREKFLNTNSSASQLKIITQFNQQKNFKTPHKEEIVLTKKKGQNMVRKKNRRSETQKRTQKLKQQFDLQYFAISEGLEKVIRKGQTVLQKFQKIISTMDTEFRRDFEICKTVELQVFNHIS